MMRGATIDPPTRPKIDEGRAQSGHNWRGDWIVNSRDRWRNLKIIRNRHHVRESVITPGKLTFHLITVYMGAPSRQQSLLSGRNYNILQTAGSVAVIPAATALRSWYDEVEQDDVYLHLEPGFVKSVAAGADLDPDRIEIVPTLESRSPAIESLARMAFDELQRGDAVATNLYADSLANLLAVQLIREYSSARQPPARRYVNGLTNKKLALVLDLIESDLSEDLSLKVLAAAAGLSEYHFLRMFKQSTGLTPHQYVIGQRIERAKELLRKGDMTITEIAYLLGFSTPAHFTHHFRRKTGLTPRDFC
ncbi:MAG: helix-turn-helix transcriptional regulator [Acidobacteria bacterium]|nr:helix-turn-helix transcriptional regulator [Acidobacteriota bacterium]